jgi:hypothetical protein
MSKPKTDLLRKLFTAPQVLDTFDFGIVYREYDCGSAGCKIGELPLVFPDDFVFVNGLRVEDESLSRQVQLKDRDTWSSFEAAEKFFGLTSSQAQHLFSPGLQIYGEDLLSPWSTREAVNANGLRFCDMVDRGEIEEDD